MRPETPNSDHPKDGAVTQLLTQIAAGDAEANDRLLSLVYGELKGLARAIFSDQSTPQTLQPTALVHEAWMKLVGNLGPVEDRRHFFIVAGKAMRQVITDHARSRQRDKRGGGQRKVTLDLDLAAERKGDVDLFELNDSLNVLAKLNERHARVAELRLFSGLSIDETAETLERSPRSVDSDWAMAKAWLRKELLGAQ